MSFTHVFPADGEYRFNFLEGDSIDAGLYPRGMETAATLVILVDGVEVARKEIGGPETCDLADRDGPEGRKAIVAKVSRHAGADQGRRTRRDRHLHRTLLGVEQRATTGGGFIGGNSAATGAGSRTCPSSGTASRS